MAPRQWNVRHPVDQSKLEVAVRSARRLLCWVLVEPPPDCDLGRVLKFCRMSGKSELHALYLNVPTLCQWCMSTARVLVLGEQPGRFPGVAENALLIAVSLCYPTNNSIPGRENSLLSWSVVLPAVDLVVEAANVNIRRRALNVLKNLALASRYDGGRRAYFLRVSCVGGAMELAEANADCRRIGAELRNLLDQYAPVHRRTEPHLGSNVETEPHRSEIDEDLDRDGEDEMPCFAESDDGQEGGDDQSDAGQSQSSSPRGVSAAIDQDTAALLHARGGGDGEQAIVESRAENNHDDGQCDEEEEGEHPEAKPTGNAQRGKCPWNISRVAEVSMFFDQQPGLWTKAQWEKMLTPEPVPPFLPADDQPISGKGTRAILLVGQCPKNNQDFLTHNGPSARIVQLAVNDVVIKYPREYERLTNEHFVCGNACVCCSLDGKCCWWPSSTDELDFLAELNKGHLKVLQKSGVTVSCVVSIGATARRVMDLVLKDDDPAHVRTIHPSPKSPCSLDLKQKALLKAIQLAAEAWKAWPNREKFDKMKVDIENHLEELIPCSVRHKTRSSTSEPLLPTVRNSTLKKERAALGPMEQAEKINLLRANQDVAPEAENREKQPVGEKKDSSASETAQTRLRVESKEITICKQSVEVMVEETIEQLIVEQEEICKSHGIEDEAEELAFQSNLEKDAEVGTTQLSGAVQEKRATVAPPRTDGEMEEHTKQLIVDDEGEEKKRDELHRRGCMHLLSLCGLLLKGCLHG
jgi:hypothetical protein